MLNEWDSKQALKAFGLPTPNGVLSTPDKALKDAEALGYPLVLKAVSAQLPHKTEAGAVALNLKDGAALSAALEKMRASIAAYAPGVAFDQLLLEPMAKAPLAELIVGVKRENDFGLALVIGAGGILVELLKRQSQPVAADHRRRDPQCLAQPAQRAIAARFPWSRAC